MVFVSNIRKEDACERAEDEEEDDPLKEQIITVNYVDQKLSGFSKFIQLREAPQRVLNNLAELEFYLKQSGNNLAKTNGILLNYRTLINIMFVISNAIYKSLLLQTNFADSLKFVISEVDFISVLLFQSS